MRALLAVVAVLGLVLGTALTAEAGVIKLLTQDTWEGGSGQTGKPDDGFIAWAEGLGHTVIKKVIGAAIDPAALQTECEGDGTQLIIIGPRNGSANYATNRAVWNAMPIPILAMLPHAVRADRLNWISTGNAGDDNQAWEDVSLDLSAHPWVAGLGTQFYDYPGTLGDTRWYKDATNVGTGEVIARRSGTVNSLAIVSWDAGDLMGDGTAAGAARALFMGTNWARYVTTAPGYQCSFDDYTADGKESLKRVINTLVPEPATLALLGLGAAATLLRRKR